MMTLEEYREILDYDPVTGEFTWKMARGGPHAGKRAGSFRKNNYGVANYIIVLNKTIIPGTRLAWFLTHGEWPATPVRFENGDHSDLRIENLRLAKPNSERAADKHVAAIEREKRRNEVWGRKDVTQARLKELFDYNPGTGKFYWRQSGKGRTLGQPAGSPDNGHMVLRVDGVSHQQHRLAWIYVHGSVPAGRRIYPINENGMDCRIENLRLAHTQYEHNVRYAKNNPTKNRENNLKKFQGMTIADYDAMLKAQGGVCRICRQPESQARLGVTRRLVVDHRHSDGKVRGLLCSRCNTALGYAMDDAARLEASAAYLRDTDAAISEPTPLKRTA